MLTTADAARQLGIPPSTLHVRRWRLKQRGVTVGTVMFGGIIGWTDSDLELVQKRKPRGKILTYLGEFRGESVYHREVEK